MLDFIFKLIDKLSKDIISPIISKIMSQIRGLKNTPQTIARYISTKAKDSVYKKPESEADYVRFGKFYVAKAIVVLLIFFIIFGAIAGVKAYQSYAKKNKAKVEMAQNLPEKNDFTGKGIVKYKDGKIKYNGDLKSGQFEGNGKLYNEKGVLIYEGAFAKGQYGGAGKLYDPASGGLVYEGSF